MNMVLNSASDGYGVWQLLSSHPLSHLLPTRHLNRLETFMTCGDMQERLTFYISETWIR